MRFYKLILSKNNKVVWLNQRCSCLALNRSQANNGVTQFTLSKPHAAATLCGFSSRNLISFKHDN